MEPVEIPGSLIDRLRSGIGPRREVWVLAAVVATLSLGGIALWARGAPARIAPPAVDESAPLPGATPEGGEGVVVHVAGKVRHPGLYTLPVGARVADAIEAAGGPRAGADLDLLNLAELLVDGTKVEVLGSGEAPSVSTSPATPDAPAAININTADQIALEQIPGIGPVKAAAIIEHRDASGPFMAVEDLLDVTGIGPATLESLRPYVTT